MGKTSEKQNGDKAPLPFEEMIKLNGSFEAAMKRGRDTFESGVKALQEESLEFFRRRLEHTSESLEQSHHCNSLVDLLGVQQKWMADFAHDCYDESVRLGGVMQQWMQNASMQRDGGDARSEKD